MCWEAIDRISYTLLFCFVYINYVTMVVFYWLYNVIYSFSVSFLVGCVPRFHMGNISCVIFIQRDCDVIGLFHKVEMRV